MPASQAAVAVAAPGEAAELRTGAAEPGKAWSKPAEADNANGPAQKHPEARKHPPIGHFEGTPGGHQQFVSGRNGKRQPSRNHCKHWLK